MTLYEFLMVLKNLAIFAIGLFTGVLLSVAIFHKLQKASKIIVYVLMGILVLVTGMLSFNIILP